MIRPPPLQLKLDNRFPHPVQTPSKPKSKSFVSQLYKASWKNPIIAVAGLNGLRYAFAAHNAFEDAIVDDAEAAENLAKVSIALGVMYSISFLIELYGITGVLLQRLSLVRAYVYLTLLASVLITSAGILNGITYFAFGDDLMLECVSLAVEGRGYEKSIFRNRPWPGSVFAIPAKAARRQCVYAWVHGAYPQVASVFLFSLIPAVIYYVMVHTYYRQTTDPSHHANLLRNKRVGTARQASYSQAGYTRVRDRNRATRDDEGTSTSRLISGGASARLRAGRSQVQANRSVRGIFNSSSYTNLAASGSPPKRKYAPRSLVRAHRPPPLMQSPSPIGFTFAGSTQVVGLSITPGPPSYRPSRVYAAFAAPVPSDDQREYDRFV